MYVANAAYAAPSATAFTPVRGGYPAGERAGERADGAARAGDTAGTASRVTSVPGFEDEPIVGRYPVVAFSFNADVSRLVMLYRDPATGETEQQIPSEVALKQYEEAQKKERAAARRKLEVVVGGADRPGSPAGSDAAAAGTGLRATGAAGGGAPSVSAAPGTTAATVGVTTQAPAPAVASAVTGTATGVSGGGAGGGGSARIDLVI